MQDNWYIVNVEGAVVKDGRYLMIVRGEGGEHAAGVLAFPGGKVEDNERAVCWRKQSAASCGKR